MSLVAAADTPSRAIGTAVADRLGVRFLDLTAGPAHLAEVLTSALRADAEAMPALARLATTSSGPDASGGEAGQVSTAELQEEVLELAARAGMVMLASADVPVPRPDSGALHVRLDAPWGRWPGDGGMPALAGRCHLALDVSRLSVAGCIEAIVVSAQAGRDAISPTVDAPPTPVAPPLPQLVEVPVARGAEPEAPAAAEEPAGGESTELLSRLAEALTAELRRQRNGSDH